MRSIVYLVWIMSYAQQLQLLSTWWPKRNGLLLLPRIVSNACTVLGRLNPWIFAVHGYSPTGSWPRCNNSPLDAGEGGTKSFVEGAQDDYICRRCRTVFFPAIIASKVADANMVRSSFKVSNLQCQNLA